MKRQSSLDGVHSKSKRSINNNEEQLRTTLSTRIIKKQQSEQPETFCEATEKLTSVQNISDHHLLQSRHILKLNTNGFMLLAKEMLDVNGVHR